MAEVADRLVRDRPLPWVAVAVVAAAVFAVLTVGVAQEPGAGPVDQRVHEWVAGHRLGWLTTLLRVVTWLGSGGVLLGVLACGVVWSWLRTWRTRPTAGPRPAATSTPGWWIRALAGFVSGWLLRYLLMVAVRRPRPVEDGWQTAAAGWAYPSGHTFNATLGWGLLAAVLVLGARRSGGRRVTTAWPVIVTAVLAGLTVGASRVYLGVHWLTDVLGSMSLGVALLAGWVLAGWVLAGQARHRQPPTSGGLAPAAATLGRARSTR